MTPLSKEALAVAHSFGHDVPGLIGGDLLPSGDPITRQRVMDTMREMAERIAELERELAEARESNTKLLLVAQEWKRDWLKSPAFQTFVDLKHGIVGDVLCALQEGEISRSKAAECLAEIAHGATEVRLPRYRGYFAEDETPVEKCERLEAIAALLRTLRDDWDGYGAKPISEAAIHVAEIMTTRPASIVPPSDGGVNLERHAAGMEIGPHGEMSAADLTK